MRDIQIFINVQDYMATGWSQPNVSVFSLQSSNSVTQKASMIFKEEILEDKQWIHFIFSLPLFPLCLFHCCCKIQMKI